MKSRGSIRQISKAKKSWKIIIELPKDEVTGKRRQKSFTCYGTKKEAEKFKTEKLRELDTGELIETKKIKFSEYLDYWLKVESQSNLRKNTVEGYKHYINRHIKPKLGNILLEDIKPIHLQKFYLQQLESGELKSGKGLSKRTVQSMHRIIHKALQQALKWRMITRNVADNVEVPKAEKYEARFLDEKEIRNLIEKVKDSELYIPVVISCFTGLRRGEVLGLTWEDIDFEKGYIKISKQLQRIGGENILVPTKTAKSNRKVAISKTLIDILKKYKTKQMENKILLGEKYGNDINAVCTYQSGKLFNPKRFSAKFNEFLKKAELPIIRFHDLRHTHASLLLKMGVKDKLISERLGHSSIGITMDLYSHIYNGEDEKIANDFDTLIKIAN